MLEFKNFEIKDVEKIKKYTNIKGAYSCETSFINLLIWQKIYDNMYAEKDGFLFLKSGVKEDENFRLPFGKDLKKGMELLCEYCGDYPTLWIQQGERFNSIADKISEDYIVHDVRDAFDYIYLQSDLANLSGKKYHSKRNHIAAFSKQYDWQYREITKENIQDILICADEWYKLNADRYDKYMQCEYEGLKIILQNLECLNAKGGAIYIEDRVVAFTVGSPINDETFDVHIEKALPQYATAYTVINNEFAKTLSQYKYINREDDMGLEGLRKAKLSYKPEILLKKYICLPKKQECRRIYHSNFAEQSNFENELFKDYFKYCRYIEDDGKIVSSCFAFPYKMGEREVLYIFAVATDEDYRNKGYATRLIEEIKRESDAILILRPQSEELIPFYERLGFKTFTATNSKNEFALKPNADLLNFAEKYKETQGQFTAMYLSDGEENLENLYFPYSMI